MFGRLLNKSLTDLWKRFRNQTSSSRTSKHSLEIINVERLINKLGIVWSHHCSLIKWILFESTFPNRVIISRQLHLKLLLQTATVFWVFTDFFYFQLVLIHSIFVNAWRYFQKMDSSQFLFFFNYLVSFYWVHLSFFLVEVYLFILYHF